MITLLSCLTNNYDSRLHDKCFRYFRSWIIPTFNTSRCNWDVSCLNGTRGVCEANEILLEDESPSAHDTKENISCSAMKNYPWKGCRLILPGASSTANLPPGRCVLKSQDNPCLGFPDNYQYDPIKKTCRAASNRTKYEIIFLKITRFSKQYFIFLSMKLQQLAQRRLLRSRSSLCRFVPLH